MAEQNNQPAQEMTQQELSEQIKIRREKLAQLQAEGKDPFEITKCEVTHHSDEIKDNFEELEEIDSICVCCGKPAKHMVYWGRAY